MPKTIISPKNIAVVGSSPFALNSPKSASGGRVLSFIKDPIDVSGVPIDTEDKEFFLNIKVKPLSPIIERVEVIGAAEVNEKRAKYDDLLNIYLPIGRVRNNSVLETGSTNGSFVFTKRTSEKRMSGFYNEGRCHLGAFLVKSPDGSILNIYKNQEAAMSEGQFLFISFSGEIKKNAEPSYEDFYINNFTFLVGGADLASVSNTIFTVADDQEAPNMEIPLSFNYPIGMIQEGNYYTFARGNTKLSINKSKISYFIREDVLETGCKESIYETKYFYSIIPEFE